MLAAYLQRPRWLTPGAQGYGITLGTINFLGVLAAMFQAMPSLQFQARPHPAQSLLLPCPVHAQRSIPDAPALCSNPVRAMFQAMPSLQFQARPHPAQTLLLPCPVHAQRSILDAPAPRSNPVKAMFQAMPSLNRRALHLARTLFGLCLRRVW